MGLMFGTAGLTEGTLVLVVCALVTLARGYFQPFAVQNGD